MIQVKLDGFLANVNFARDGFVGVTYNDQLEDFGFTWGKIRNAHAFVFPINVLCCSFSTIMTCPRLFSVYFDENWLYLALEVLETVYLCIRIW